MEDEPPGRCGGVDVLGEGAETRAALLDGLDDLQQVAQRAGEAVVFGHDDDIALAQVIEQPVQLRTAAHRPADLVSEDARAPGGAQGVLLGVEALVFGGDAGVTDNHARQSDKNRTKRQRFCQGILSLSTA